MKEGEVEEIMLDKLKLEELVLRSKMNLVQVCEDNSPCILRVLRKLSYFCHAWKMLLNAYVEYCFAAGQEMDSKGCRTTSISSVGTTFQQSQKLRTYLMKMETGTGS